MLPSERVLDLFAVPADVQPLAGGQGASVRAGDLVLSPGRDPAVCAWLNPVLARLAVRLDERPARSFRDLRIAMPVPARDGEWVVDGWGASRWEPGTTSCTDVDVLVATGRLLHAELAGAVPSRPAGLARRDDRWASAEREAFEGSPAGPDLVRRLAGLRDDTPLGPDQLVHADLAGNVLLDAAGAPVVLDLAPAWRPARWAEAVTVLDAALWLGAPLARLHDWAAGPERQAMLRAALFRLLSDVDPPLDRYEAALAPVLG
ncbi:aminoglycoside phosphotransferase [Nocardioides panaciterrulae]|uniref:Uncharacterized protein (TIGR02569 family) n=1 Tax=Nocardioides panaciterrulae TaxID=661492 RepID=A0A7Y9E741_9ACTN|nr:aminoglycoside phosphotransferase [Nocardioides panaciterrulae]NYD42439.1 uncharacterized protein (TIGR02569 family) [Nocardioides panaciterrulae]